ncbi:hypothetical protein HYZ97_03060 [Candidatus Pacearchaeota archaeon]|nr:hypothetical protein [Candidatus Pacearchaeota archaeon]
MVYFRIQHNIDSKYLRLCEELKRQASQSNLEQKETRNSILSLLEKLIELLHAQQKRRRK